MVKTIEHLPRKAAKQIVASAKVSFFKQKLAILKVHAFRENFVSFPAENI